MSRKMLRNVEKTRSSSRQNAPDSLATPLPPDSLTTDHWPLFCRHSLLLPLPPAGNRVRFSCSIPRLFVLSRNMSMINTTGKLASFGRFFIPFSSLPADSLATMPSPHAPRRHQRVQVVRGPPPWLPRHQPPNPLELPRPQRRPRIAGSVLER